jgi:hypothetical protein
MKWSDLPLRPTPRVLRQFAWAWLIFFLALGAFQYFRRGHHELGVGLGTMALVVGGLGLARPAAVRWLFVSLTLLAFPIGWIASQIMLLLLFYLIITPLAFLFRLRGRDLLMRKPAPERSSFWQTKKMPVDPRSYLRQY